MNAQVLHFFVRNDIVVDDLMYLTRHDRRSILHMKDGRTVATFLPIKTIMEELPFKLFLSINKGIVINRSFLSQVERNTYRMQDGTVFTGRARGNKEHQLNRAYLDQREEFRAILGDRFSEYSPFDDLPVPYCIAEVERDANGSLADMTVRYCNRAVSEMMSLKLAGLKGKSLIEYSPEPDAWVPFLESAISDRAVHTFECYSQHRKERLRFYVRMINSDNCSIVVISV